MEEALVSRVSCLTSVLSLPNGDQLGYRGSVINFVRDLSGVTAQLPRTPKDSGIIFYMAEGSTLPASKEFRDLVRVRGAAVREHLEFFAKYHEYYQYGIRDPNRPDHYLVPPFTTGMIDKDTLKGFDKYSKHGDVPPLKDLNIQWVRKDEGCGADEDAGRPIGRCVAPLRLPCVACLRGAPS